ncbi:MAG: nitrate reductase gamma subunit, partial [Thermodesulfobacteriota bacterium]|nr:nitrate reductase gamma subunit [Thermodesulfobacteriota bacterium]
MNVKYMFSLVAVILMFLLAYVGVEAAGLQVLFGIVIPYAALIVFIIGVINRVIGWARSPVPFGIPSTCGQQRSLPWIKASELDNPFTKPGVVARMF